MTVEDFLHVPVRLLDTDIESGAWKARNGLPRDCFDPCFLGGERRRLKVANSQLHRRVLDAGLPDVRMNEAFVIGGRFGTEVIGGQTVDEIGGDLQDGRLTGWQTYRMAGLQDGRITGWQDGGKDGSTGAVSNFCTFTFCHPAILPSCNVYEKVATTGAWSLVPTSFCTVHAVALAASVVLAST